MISELIAWDKNFRALERYVAAAYSFETGAGNTLHGWIQEQRAAGIQGRLTAERRQRLEAIGFLYSNDPVVLGEQTWNLHLLELTRVVQKVPRFVPSESKNRCPKLDRWLRRNISLARAGALPSERVQQLREVVPHLLLKLRRTSTANEPSTHARALGSAPQSVV